MHATHLTDADIATLGHTRTTACLCPTTERDLADGIGPARAAADAGCPLTLGSDQHAVIDMFEEARGLEMHERLNSAERGRFTPAELLGALTGHASIGWPDAGRLEAGATRRSGCRPARHGRGPPGGAPDQVMLAATAADVDTVIVGGEPIVESGRHRLGDVAASAGRGDRAAVGGRRMSPVRTSVDGGALEGWICMELGVHVSNFTWPGGPPQIAPDLTRIATAAEDHGFAKLSVMDHVWQIGHIGPPEHDMLEAYTTLGYLAARTSRIKLLGWVTAVVYREPGLLAKAVTTLDVLSEGRAWLGIGAAWNEPEARGLGLSFPPTAERFERLEEALQICLQMWSDDDSPYNGKHYQLERTLNSPQALTRPHPPILIGGGGERRPCCWSRSTPRPATCSPGPELEHKLDVLRGHCADVGRDYDEIEKTVMGPLDPGPDGENIDGLIDGMQALAALGITHYHGSVPDAASIRPIELLGERVIPVVADLTGF